MTLQTYCVMNTEQTSENIFTYNEFNFPAPEPPIINILYE